MTKSAIPLFVLLCVSLPFTVGCIDDNVDVSSPGVAPEEAAADADAPGGVESGWRDGRTVEVLPASGNAVEFLTRDVQAPTRPNLPGDREWIISRIEGGGFTRLLIMTMYTDGGVRGETRIFLEGPGGGFWDNRFRLPLSGVAHWRVEYSGGALRIILDGQEIWSRAGNYSVDRAVMANSPPRGFIGYWSPVNAGAN